jgi:hypothetical protein
MRDLPAARRETTRLRVRNFYINARNDYSEPVSSAGIGVTSYFIGILIDCSLLLPVEKSICEQIISFVGNAWQTKRLDNLMKMHYISH